MTKKEAEQSMRRFAQHSRNVNDILAHRSEICLEITQAGNYPEAESVFHRTIERVSTISLDTVHWDTSFGLIKTLGMSKGHIRLDANLERLQHLVCDKCGLMSDLSSENQNDLKIPYFVRSN